jgi:hypothetical protein
MSVPGIGLVSGSVILVEIGDYHDLEMPNVISDPVFKGDTI